MVKVLMFGSTFSTKGGMVSVVKNYFSYNDWNEYKITYIPTHFDGYRPLMMSLFVIRYIQTIILVMFGGYKIAHLHTAERGSFWRKAILVNTLRLFKIKTIMHHHGAEFEDFFSKCSNVKKSLISKTLELVDVNIVLSKRLVNMIKAKSPRANVEVLYNAVTTYDRNLYNMESSNILFLGRLGKRKGIYDLIECIQRIDNKIDKRNKFYFCGDGDIEEVKNKIKEMNLNHRIAYVGWIDGESKMEFLKNTMINVLPSYNEGLPMTILETMAYGIPNISTCIASIPEVLKDGENGFLINPGDIDSLSMKLMDLINNEYLRKNFSNESYELIKGRFSLDKHIAKLKKIYMCTLI